MKKEKLIERAERWKQECEKMPKMGYPRNGQKEIVKISVAVIKTLCEIEDMTPYRATQALKMATDIIDEESKYETIS